ncbi:MAG TPA: D-alanyl-D-alanine carboxypeptidase [Candidatus Enterocloster faecavium]|uniref:D-alanyl-D-alanine carboxypeptidase n=1 Tax=Candidatus Enterocloster faecavium TaxID=2838560 RepID=A0A9D2RMD6_9FIRM|nr:D-alanyl-D-alanine carboxypeptidase [Candidatus Enterocloster faecavium]
MKGILKKMAGLLLAAGLSIGCAGTALARPDWPSDMGIMAEGGIVMDFNSGAVIFGQNIHQASPPASITKLLTALVVLENSSLDETVTFSYDAINNVEAGSGNKLSLETGDQLSVEDCLYAMLLVSSNQAANALAEHVGGSREGFVEMMNQKIEELGCGESHFANPSGLNDEDQYVSPYDMALIAKAAFSNETLLTIDSAKTYTMPATINNPDGLTIQMEHRLLVTEDPSSQFYCEGAVAGKTGYTSLAGNTLVTYAARDGQELIAVVLKGSQPQYYLDSKTLLEFGFSNFQNWNIAENETAYTTGQEPIAIGETQYEPSDLSLDADAQITLPNSAEFADADRELVTDLGEDRPMGAVALVQYSYNDREIGSSYLYSAKALQAAMEESAAQEESEAQEQPQETQASTEPEEAHKGISLSVILIPVLVLAAAALTAGAVFYIRREQKREREELARRRERRLKRLRESGVSEEEFERLRQERFGDKPGKRRH